MNVRFLRHNVTGQLFLRAKLKIEQILETMALYLQNGSCLFLIDYFNLRIRLQHSCDSFFTWQQKFNILSYSVSIFSFAQQYFIHSFDVPFLLIFSH